MLEPIQLEEPEVCSLHVPMSLWPPELTSDTAGPPAVSPEAMYDEALERRLGAAYEGVCGLSERFWAAVPVKHGGRIDCWLARFDCAEGITAVEDLGRQHGLCWSLPEAGEMAVPSHLGDDRTLCGQLERLWQAREGWMILEAGADLDWYVQVLLDGQESLAHVEAVAGRFAPSRLQANQRRMLQLLGFAVPGDVEACNAHRSQRLDSTDARGELAERMQRVMREVYGCREGDPVVMRLGR